MTRGMTLCTRWRGLAGPRILQGSLRIGPETATLRPTSRNYEVMAGIKMGDYAHETPPFPYKRGNVG